MTTPHTLADRITTLCAAAPGTWSVVIRPVDEGVPPLAAFAPQRVLCTASSAKILVLLALADQIAAGRIDPGERIDRGRVDAVRDSGLWQHLNQTSLAIADIAILVGAVSDNWATNVLIDRLGLKLVSDTAERHGVTEVRLHDLVRDTRGSDDPPTLSTGHAAGYAALMALLWRGRTDPALCRVLTWLRTGVDHSMVAGAFGLDPLAHAEPDHGVTVVNKTGTDVGVRADSGLIRADGRTLAYSCLVNWDEPGRGGRHQVLRMMRRLGDAVATYLRMSY